MLHNILIDLKFSVPPASKDVFQVNSVSLGCLLDSNEQLSEM